MNYAGELKATMTREPRLKPIEGRAPAMNCPVCGGRSNTRSSEEISPTIRRLYYFCTDLHCHMTWTALLSFEEVVSPSGIAHDFRAPRVRNDKPPGADFGQMTTTPVIPKLPTD